MHALMQDWSLTLDKLLDHAARWHGAREVVTRSVEGPVTRSTYAQVHHRAKYPFRDRSFEACAGLGDQDTLRRSCRDIDIANV